MGFLIPIFAILILNAGIVSVTRRKFGECLPITLIAPILALYISQYVFHTFRIAYVLLAAAGVWAILHFIRHRKESIHSYCSFGFYAFLMICAWYVVIDWGRSFSVSDEMGFWGMMVREMLRLDRFYSVADSFLTVHKDYPPFFPLFEMLFCKLSGGFREDFCSMALHIFSFGLLVPAMEIRHRGGLRSCIRSLAMLAFCVLLVFSLDGDGIAQTIYLDYPMAMVAAGAFLLILKGRILHSRFDLAVYSLLMTLLLMGKQIGIFYYGLSTLYLIITAIQVRWTKEEVRCVRCALAGIAAPVLWWGSWKMYIRRLDISGQFDLGQISLESILKTIADKDYVKESINNYAVAVTNQQLSRGSLTISFFSSIFLVTLLVLVLRRIYRELLGRRAACTLIGIMDFGGIGYAVLMLILYILCFSEIEFTNLMNFPRYMGSYVVFALLVIYLIFCRLEDERREGGIEVSVLAISFCVLAILNAEALIHMEPQVIWGDPYTELREIGSYLDNNTEAGSRIYVVDSEGRIGYMQTYYSCDGRWIDPESSLSSSENIMQDAEAFIEKVQYAMQEYDYIWIASANEEQKEILRQFLPEDELEDGTLISLKEHTS